jgi:hypothetical protein
MVIDREFTLVRSHAMDENIKALMAKVRKDAELDLEIGTTFVEETLLVHVSGTVVKQKDALVAPTTSLPLIPILALFWEKSGICRDHALRMLKEAITEAMANGKAKNEQIEARIKDVEASVKAVKEDLIAKLPKVKRSGRVVTKDLHIEVLPVDEEVFEPAAA